MKYIVLLVSLIALASAETYEPTNDHIDIEGIVADNTKLKSFVDCFMGLQQCDEIAADFKKNIPEAVQSACSKCTQAQMHIFKVFLAGLQEKLPEEFNDFKKKYDPEGEFFPKLETAIHDA